VRLLDEMRGRIRLRHLSIRTERAYVGWVRRFVLAFGKRHPRELGGKHVEAFLTTLAVSGRVAPSTQNQALAALLFLYREVLGQDLPWMDDIVRAKRSRRAPVVLTPSEVRAVLDRIEGRAWVMAALLYGTGMRLMECLRLRVHDVDFQRNEITVRDGKGGKDRRVPLPNRLRDALQRQVAGVRPVARTGSGRRRWLGALAVRAGAQVHRRGARARLAVPVPGAAAGGGSEDRRRATAPCR
jgi:integrase